METLNELAIRHHTDKSTEHHAYTLIYERYFSHLRFEPITVVEYGVGGYGDPRAGGESLRMWSDYFDKATVIGIDNQPKTLDLPGRVRVLTGDQADAGLAGRIAEDYGLFDIVIDDASHCSELTIATFAAVWPLVRPGGFYVCEDTWLAYTELEDPQGARAQGPTSVQWFKGMVDEVSYRLHWRPTEPLYPERFWRGYAVEFAHFWPSLVILRKAAR
jgi:hypothetical protein